MEAQQKSARQPLTCLSARVVASFAMEKKLDGGAQDPTMLLRVLICAYDRGMMTEKVESKEES